LGLVLARLRAARRARPTATPTSAREQFLEEARELTPVLGAETEIGLFCVSPRDRGKGKALFLSGAVEDAELAIALRTLDRLGTRPLAGGGVFVDVGAHIGIATIAALTTHGFASALAIEPEPLNHRLLRANLAINGLDGRAQTARTAISAAEGEAALELSAGSHGKHRLLRAERVERAREKGSDLVNVPTRRLDDLLAEHGLGTADVGLLKIDTEGHEPHVLQGARAVLEARVPVVIEWAPFRMGDEIALAEQIVREHYGRFQDLRAARSGTDELEPVEGLDALRARYAPQGTKSRLTDLLLLP
jgi:FkbM family methyltransferase